MADPVRTRLGRIRCLVQAVEAMQRGDALPKPLCYVPTVLTLECQPDKVGGEQVELHEKPDLTSPVLNKLMSAKTHLLTVKGFPCFNKDGGWFQTLTPFENNWILVQPTERSIKTKFKILKSNDKDMLTWMDAVEQCCSLQLSRAEPTLEGNEETMTLLQNPPPGWTLEADEELAKFLVKNSNKFNTDVTAQGSEYLVKIEASSAESEIVNLMDPDFDSSWESDGDQGSHWLKFYMKPGVVVQKFSLLVDPDDSSYIPRRVVVKAGNESLRETISQRTFSPSDYSKRELELFPFPLSVYYPVIEVCVKACYQGGIDTRIHGIKLVCQTASMIIPESENVREDIFTPESTSRWPKLDSFTSHQLFYRSILLKRVASLIDKDLSYILPQWQYSRGGLGAVTSLRQLWPLCGSRNALIDQLLQKTTEKAPSDLPVVYINRIAAKQHREDPTIDPEQKKTVFNQLMKELKKVTKPSEYNYRWAGHWTQWWECKFLQEGVIDQGGGFRDSLSDIAEELCPPSLDCDVPLPLFIRSPNQSQDSSNVYRDAYTPNPSCDQFAKYSFVGQLMGAAFRSQEIIVLSLPQFLWKELVGEPVTWTRDFVSVDSAEVKLIDSIESMESSVFNSTFAGVLNFTTVLSNGKTVPLVPGGEDRYVTYEDRLEYCRLVKKARMSEGKAQISAIKEGLVQVVPQQVLALLTWQELEVKVCGSPEIPIEDLKRSAKYDSDLSPTSPNVKVMWEALEGFTNEERSRFIRFITGRRRLPATIYIDSADTGPSSLPTSATCSNALYLPSYTTVEQAASKLRYAAYNCVAIDTDMSPIE